MAGVGIGYKLGWDDGFDAGTNIVNRARATATRIEHDAVYYMTAYEACVSAYADMADNYDILASARDRYRSVIREWRKEACLAIPRAAAPPIPPKIL